MYDIICSSIFYGTVVPSSGRPTMGSFTNTWWDDLMQ